MSLRTHTTDRQTRPAGEDHLLLQENLLKNGNTLPSINSTTNAKGQ